MVHVEPLPAVKMPAPSQPPDPWLTRSEVAHRLQIPEKTLAQWASQGKGPRYARFGRHSRYRLSDVIAWENAQFGSGNSPEVA